MARIRFSRDIYAGASLLYRKDQVIHADAQMAKALILASHASNADEGEKLDRSSTPGNVTINTPQGRAAFAAAGTQVVVRGNAAATGITPFDFAVLPL